MTSMPPFLPETVIWPLTRGRLVRRSSQTFSLPPKKLLLWLLPSSELQGVVVKDWACSRGMAARRVKLRTNLVAGLRMVVSFGLGEKGCTEGYGEGWGFVPGCCCGVMVDKFRGGLRTESCDAHPSQSARR